LTYEDLYLILIVLSGLPLYAEGARPQPTYICFNGPQPKFNHIALIRYKGIWLAQTQQGAGMSLASHWVKMKLWRNSPQSQPMWERPGDIAAFEGDYVLTKAAKEAFFSHSDTRWVLDSELRGEDQNMDWRNGRSLVNVDSLGDLMVDSGFTQKKLLAGIPARPPFD
jgi:hypothetical protein